jgi:hypothetical protein
MALMPFPPRSPPFRTPSPTGPILANYADYKVLIASNLQLVPAGDWF